MDPDLPRKVVIQGLEIFFKYTGQLITCYRRRSADHVVKKCPKQQSHFSHISVGDRVLSNPPNPSNPPNRNETQMETASAEDLDDAISESATSKTLSSMLQLYSGAVS